MAPLRNFQKDIFMRALLIVLLWLVISTVGLQATSANSREVQAKAFSDLDLQQGFLRLAFGSDLQAGDKGVRIRRFDRRARFFLRELGSVPRGQAYRKILKNEFATISGIP